MNRYDPHLNTLRESGPNTHLTNGMRWFPVAADEDRDVPPWSWLCPEPDRTVTHG